MPFPDTRLRRLRASRGLRRMVRETTLSPDDFILPIFVVGQKGAKEEISAMPGVYRWGVDRLGEILDEAQAVGIPSVILFGLPDQKSPQGESALKKDSIFPKAIAAAKRHAPEMVVLSDVCFCGFTHHGHCGVFKDGVLLNDETLDLLGRQAVVHAEAGVDMVAPSDMTDGKIQAIRGALDDAGFEMTPIMSYAAKFASAYYGPFRVAADNKPAGDRRTYQEDPANPREALHEVLLDADEGADIVMVKPALAFLDVIRRVKDSVDIPVAAYNVSGEYAMVKAAAEKGWIDGDRVMMENLLAMRRAGADLILTYHAVDASRLLASGWEP